MIATIKSNKFLNFIYIIIDYDVLISVIVFTLTVLFAFNYYFNIV